jgi:hypothetical protein
MKTTGSVFAVGVELEPGDEAIVAAIPMVPVMTIATRRPLIRHSFLTTHAAPATPG